jgi:thioredoxin 2
MSVTFKKVANVLEQHMRLAKVNIEVKKEIARRLQIRSTPCLVIFDHGQEISRNNGTMTCTNMITWANNLNIWHHSLTSLFARCGGS